MEKTCNTCFHYYHNKHTNSICRHALMCNKHDKWEPYTNGDWIRTASDDELAEFLCKTTGNGMTQCGTCIAADYCTFNHTGYADWLKKRKESDDESE